MHQAMGRPGRAMERAEIAGSCAGRFAGNGSASHARAAVLAAYVSRAVEAALEAARSGWLDERYSPLGPLRHVAAVRRRVSDRQPGGPISASIDGERHWLSLAALTEEYAALPARPRSRRRSSAEDAGLAALRALLSYVAQGAA